MEPHQDGLPQAQLSQMQPFIGQTITGGSKPRKKE